MGRCLPGCVVCGAIESVRFGEVGGCGVGRVWDEKVLSGRCGVGGGGRGREEREVTSDGRGRGGLAAWVILCVRIV